VTTRVHRHAFSRWVVGLGLPAVQTDAHGADSLPVGLLLGHRLCRSFWVESCCHRRVQRFLCRCLYWVAYGAENVTSRRSKVLGTLRMSNRSRILQVLANWWTQCYGQVHCTTMSMGEYSSVTRLWGLLGVSRGGIDSRIHESRAWWLTKPCSLASYWRLVLS